MIQAELITSYRTLNRIIKVCQLNDLNLVDMPKIEEYNGSFPVLMSTYVKYTPRFNKIKLVPCTIEDAKTLVYPKTKRMSTWAKITDEKDMLRTIRLFKTLFDLNETNPLSELQQLKINEFVKFRPNNYPVLINIVKPTHKQVINGEIYYRSYPEIIVVGLELAKKLVYYKKNTVL